MSDYDYNALLRNYQDKFLSGDNGDRNAYGQGWQPSNGALRRLAPDQAGTPAGYYKYETVDPNNQFQSGFAVQQPDSFMDKYGWLAPLALVAAPAVMGAAGASAAGASGAGLGSAAELAAANVIPAATSMAPATAAELASMGVGDLFGGAAAAGGAGAGAGALSSLGGSISKAAGNMGITDWINAAGTIGNILTTNKAADAAAAGANAATAEQRREYDQTRADFAPWREAGTNALTQLTAGLAPDGKFMHRFGMEDFQADPGYQFRVSEGQKGIESSAAARGMALSGATLKALERYRQGAASDEYGNAYNRYNNDISNQFNRLSGVSGTGQQVTNSVAQAGQNMANNVSQNQMTAANARASGYIGSGNAITGGVNNYLNAQSSNRLLDMLRRPSGLSNGLSDGYSLGGANYWETI